MITRAQAEALLTLAESLEACERVGLTARSSGDFEFQYGTQDSFEIQKALWGEVTGHGIRTALAQLISK